MKKLIPYLVSFLLIFYSCHKKEKTKILQKTGISSKQKATVWDETAASNDKTTESTLMKKGLPPDFVINDYEIQYEAEGDLNNDRLPDRVCVFRKKTDTLARRTVIVFLQTYDNSYHPDKISKSVFPHEYNEANFKIYDTEDISIENGELNIKLYGIGPSGNLFSKFKYVNNNLLLTYIETYSMGAGSHSALYFEVMRGKLTEEVINMMKEEPSSSSKTYHLKRQQLSFENTSPEEVIIKAYSDIKTD